MCRVLVFAIAVIAGFSLAGCGLDSGQSGSAIPLAGPETVGDAAATIAHRPTDSQNTAAAIDAVGVLGSRLNALAESAGDPDDLSGGAICRDGTEFFAPARRIGGASTETRAFYDPACTQLARDAIRVVTSRGPATETVERSVLLYAPGRSMPIGLRRETSAIADARFGRWGFPMIRDGFSRTTSSSLWIANRKQSIAKSEFVLLPGSGRNNYCQDSAAFSSTGFPSLDATFGWQSGTLGSQLSTTRTTDGRGIATLTTTQTGNSFVGPIGSLSIVSGQSHGCPAALPAFRIGGGAPAGIFTIPIRATYRHGVLWNLSVNDASLAGGYRFAANTVRTGFDAPNVTGVLVNGGIRIASLAADAFGNGTLTITSTGAQYHLIDWTIVR